jgi:hypothetical protein
MNTQIQIGDMVKVQGRSGIYQVNKIDGNKVQLLAGGVNLIVASVAKVSFYKKPLAQFKGI